MEDLQKIGLFNNSRLNIDADDLAALLAGRRTDMLRLENLEMAGVRIAVLDAKLSLKPDADGVPRLMLHPIYREPQVPEFLTDTQAQMLEKGEVANLQKTIIDGQGNPKEVLIEYDKDTKEFIVTDTDRILEPEEINGIPLTGEQKERYRKGKEVLTDDGTTLQYSGTDKQGIRSDKLALIASILIDGGVSYVLFRGLNALFNREQDKEYGCDFEKTLKVMKDKAPAQGTVLQPGEDFDEGNSISR